jgi:hypothetical protein
MESRGRRGRRAVNTSKVQFTPLREEVFIKEESENVGDIRKMGEDERQKGRDKNNSRR